MPAVRELGGAGPGPHAGHVRPGGRRVLHVGRRGGPANGRSAAAATTTVDFARLGRPCQATGQQKFVICCCLGLSIKHIRAHAKIKIMFFLLKVSNP